MDAYTIPEAARALGVTPRELREWIEEGRLRAFESGGRRLVPRAQVRQIAPRPPDFRVLCAAGRR
jgi:excisionase family DNA binding protein